MSIDFLTEEQCFEYDQKLTYRFHQLCKLPSNAKKDLKLIYRFNNITLNLSKTPIKILGKNRYSFMEINIQRHYVPAPAGLAEHGLKVKETKEQEPRITILIPGPIEYPCDQRFLLLNEMVERFEIKDEEQLKEFVGLLNEAILKTI